MRNLFVSPIDTFAMQPDWAQGEFGQRGPAFGLMIFKYPACAECQQDYRPKAPSVFADGALKGQLAVLNPPTPDSPGRSDWQPVRSSKFPTNWACCGLPPRPS